MTIAILFHPDCLGHDPGPGHPESPARLAAIVQALRQCEFAGQLQWIEPPLGTPAQIALVHAREHYEAVVRAAPEEGDYAQLDGDTAMSHGSLKAALRAVGAGCFAVDEAMQGKLTRAFCAVRPPGHHATPERAMGFCLFNNIAIAARHAMQMHGLQRIAIVDFDVHHGNGTQDAFAQECRVLYVSTHQWPHYPGSGGAEETGAGNLLNLPLASGTGSAAYRALFSSRVIPALHEFRPQLLLASAGFDAHRHDPLAGLALAEEDFRWIGEQLRLVADEQCGGKIISFLEGGYDLRALADSTVSYVSAFV